MKYLPPEFGLTAVGLMIVGDGVIAYSWKAIASTFTEESVSMGIAIGFVTATIFKAIYMMFNPITKEI